MTPLFDRSDPEFLSHVRNATRILRKPYRGIVSGYHKLPYVLIGPDRASERRSIEIRGRIHVSPRLIFSPNPEHPTFRELFENEVMSEQLSGRIFSFLYTQRYSNLKIQHEDFTVNKSEDAPELREHQVMDEMLKQEIVDTAVIGCPNVEYYPISLERYIMEMLDRELH